MYPDWCEIFGRDRATGEHAQDFSNIANEIRDEEGMQEGNTPVEGNPSTPVETPLDFMCSSDRQDQGSASSTRKGKKRATEEVDKNLAEMLDAFCNQADARMDKLANRIGHEVDVSNARKKVHEALCNIPNITRRDRLVVTKHLVKNHEEMDMFFSLPTEDRDEFVQMILDGSI